MTAPSIPPARRFEYRAYQEQAIGDIRVALRTYQSVILYAPTGSGKTAIACDITSKAVALGRKVLFIGDSTEIIEQTSTTMDSWGVGHGIIQAGNTRRAPWELVHIGTIQTLRNRDLPKKDIVFCDEAHLCRAKSWHTVIEQYLAAGTKVIGLTATPCRLDGKPLGLLFQHIVYCPSIKNLTSLGYLVPFRVFAPPAPSTNKVGTVGGDFNRGQLSAMMDKARLIGDAVEHYGRVARGRLAILAATSIEHSQHLMAAFRAAGIRSEHADGTTPQEERKRVLSMSGSGVICQVDICGKGWDSPEVSCAIDCRPTRSLARWLQFAGRAIRVADGKYDAILLDHAGNVHRFGMPDEPREWLLSGKEGVKMTADPALSVSTCRKCFGTFRRGPDKCPYCGWVIERNQRTVEQEEGRLEEVRSQQKKAAIDEWRKRADESMRRRKFEEYQRIGAERGYKPGWPAVKFKATFGQWPPAEWRTQSADGRLLSSGPELDDGLGPCCPEAAC